VIELQDIWRTYDVGGRPLHALREIDETIESGEHISIMGPSGSGKSTLLNVIGCLDRPTSGSYRLGGRKLVFASDREQVVGDAEANGLVRRECRAPYLFPRAT